MSAFVKGAALLPLFIAQARKLSSLDRRPSSKGAPDRGDRLQQAAGEVRCERNMRALLTTLGATSGGELGSKVIAADVIVGVRSLTVERVLEVGARQCGRRRLRCRRCVPLLLVCAHDSGGGRRACALCTRLWPELPSGRRSRLEYRRTRAVVAVWFGNEHVWPVSLADPAGWTQYS